MQINMWRHLPPQVSQKKQTLAYHKSESENESESD